jgi:hypothetical protein
VNKVSEGRHSITLYTGKDRRDVFVILHALQVMMAIDSMVVRAAPHLIDQRRCGHLLSKTTPDWTGRGRMG